jgi:hypothetical protein
MKQKLLMLLAVLLTGGMLVACGPGDEVDDAGAGVVDEPGTATTDTFGDEAVDADPFAEDTATDIGEDGDIAGGGEADVAEGETVEIEVGEDEAAVESAAADDTPADLDVAEEGDAEEGAAEEETAEVDADEEVAGGGAAAPAGERVVVSFVDAAEGVAVDNIEGDDAGTIAAANEPNPELNLTSGQRYEFAYDGEGDITFFDAEGQALLSSAGDGEFFGDADVNAEAEDGRLSFTVTQELAQEIDSYTIGAEDDGGSVIVN